ncbi:MAG: hypothetical protein ACKPJJ_10290, partial [Planctomycetaceae bacterium]
MLPGRILTAGGDSRGLRTCTGTGGGRNPPSAVRRGDAACVPPAGRGWDDETVLRTLEIVCRISCRRAAWHLAAATLTSRKGAKAESW